MLSHRRAYLGSEERKGVEANLLVCVADVRYFMTSAHSPVVSATYVVRVAMPAPMGTLTLTS